MTKVVIVKPENKKFAMFYEYSESEINSVISQQESDGWRYLHSQLVLTDGTSHQLILFFQKDR